VQFGDPSTPERDRVWVARLAQSTLGKLELRREVVRAVVVHAPPQCTHEATATARSYFGPSPTTRMFHAVVTFSMHGSHRFGLFASSTHPSNSPSRSGSVSSTSAKLTPRSSLSGASLPHRSHRIAPAYHDLHAEIAAWRATFSPARAELRPLRRGVLRRQIGEGDAIGHRRRARGVQRLLITPAAVRARERSI
jgi:hypothetical protein